MAAVDVRYRTAAVNDLEDIYRRVLRVSASHEVARGYVEPIRARCRRIGLAPSGGRPRDDLAIGLRSVPFENRAVIVYRLTDEGVEVMNIFYGGRDYAALYRGSTGDG